MIKKGINMKIRSITSADLINVYKNNKFLIEDQGKEVWFSIEQIIDKKYFEIPFAIITAWNPINDSRSIEANIFMNNKLKEKIKSLKYVYTPAVGKYNEHSEDSFIIYRLPKRLALELGREFNQYSVFYNDSRYLGVCRTHHPQTPILL